MPSDPDELDPCPGPPALPIYWDWDLQHDVITWSGELSTVLDVPTGEVVTHRGWWEAQIHPDDLPAVRSGIERLVHGAQTRWSGAYRVRGRDGLDIPLLDRASLVEHDGQPDRIVGVIDRADRMAAQPSSDPFARLRLSERRFETFVEHLPLLVWEADAAGWLDFYNRGWYEYTGTTPAEMAGWGWTRVHDPLDLPRMLRVWRRALANGQAWEDAFRLRRGSDGMLRWHLSRAFPLKDADGKVLRWFGTCTDIHDQRLALEERERLLRDAQTANRTKDEFLAIVSHELRTPLSVVLTWAQLLHDRDVDPSRLATGVERIQRNARLLAQLIEDLLDVSRIVGGKFTVLCQPTDLHAPVQQAIEALRAEADRKHVHLEFDACPACPPVLGSPQRLQQIATNLISNAIRFCEAGQWVRVELRHEEAGTVALEVRDNGPGIDPEQLPMLFDRFRQANTSVKRTHGGLGLGLYIVRHLVQAHGGTVSAESEGPGRGATFTVRLPTVTGTLINPPAADSAAPVTLVGRKVLIVDDEPESREVLAVLLTRCGATVAMSGSVAGALDQLRTDVPDVVVSDIAMPEVDGYGLLERLRASDDPRWRTLRTLALTAHASAQDRAAALRAGFDAYLSKPFDATMLAQKIAELAAAQVRDR